MMKKTYHILNGDALKDRFPEEIQGEVVVARECLVDGPVDGENLSQFFEVRARFLSENYGGTMDEYQRLVAREFEAIRLIPPGSEVYLWFEDDLFCQVNLWFVASLLAVNDELGQVHLVRPPKLSQYGFGGLNQSELLGACKAASNVRDLDQFAALWEHYRNQDIEKLLAVAEKLKRTFPFVRDAVQAHLDRLPKAGYPGRPKQVLIEIMTELDTEEFGPVFKEFCRREPIYGFGDSQVKRLLQEIKAQQ